MSEIRFFLHKFHYCSFKTNKANISQINIEQLTIMLIY